MSHLYLEAALSNSLRGVPGKRQLALPSAGVSPWRKTSNSLTRTPRSQTCRAGLLTPGTGRSERKSSKGSVQKVSTPKTPNYLFQDRFIPNRGTTDVEMGHYAVRCNDYLKKSPRMETMYNHHLNDALSKGKNPQDVKVLSFKQKMLYPKEDLKNALDVSHGKNCQTAKLSKTRYISQMSDRILDAPDLLDDYYLNLMDWSSKNYLAVGLGGSVYLLDTRNSSVIQLLELPNPDDYMTSVSFIQDGNILGVGTSSGLVQLWDINQQKLLRIMSGHQSRVSSLSWNSYILSSGSRTGEIHHHDVRVANHLVATLNNHVQEVCGLSWSNDGKLLASGGNDNILNVWNPVLGTNVTPLHTLTDHRAAVKALSWCPWQSNLLASGAGLADSHIRLWNTLSGSCIKAVDTQSQVSSLLWSSEYKELISAHGFSENQLIIWKYPSLVKAAELFGHTDRILSLSLSPDGSTVASAAADETIRLWKCFPISAKSKKELVSSGKNKLFYSLFQAIR